MTTTSTPLSASDRSRGRGYFWGGIFLCLLGLALVVGQLSLKYLIVPWYSPALATVGVLLLVIAVVQRWSIPRIAGLLLVAAIAGSQWYMLGSAMKLPAYEGPAQAGKQLPPFQSQLAAGTPFTDADLKDGNRRVLVFFRGRW